MTLNSRVIRQALVMPTEKIGYLRMSGGVFDENNVVATDSLLDVTADGRVVTAAEPVAPTAFLAGEYLFGGYVLRHFGHFLLDTCSRLWFAKERPDLPIIWPDSGDLPEYGRDILKVIGLPNPVIFVTEPTRVETLHLPQPSCHLTELFYREQAEVMGQLEYGPATPGRKVWLSRSSLRPPRGAMVLEERRVERRLQDAGWEVLHPEKHSVPEQLEIYATAEHVAGFEGSAFHTLLLFKQYGGKVTLFERGRKVPNTYVEIAKAAGLRQEILPVGVQWVRGDKQHGTFSLPNASAILDALDVPRPILPALKPPNHTVRRVNALVQDARKASYLEIGVSEGDSFFSIPLARKVAVDPQFRFDPRMRESANERYFETRSDEYFVTYARDAQFDIVFIDGLHTFEQTYRDFCNVLQVLAPGGLILIDDTVPSDPHSTIPDYRLAIQSRKAAGGRGWAWHGDVFKTVFAIHDFHPMLSYATIQGRGNPQTLVWREPRRDFRPCFNSLEKISRLTWDDLQANRKILRLAPEQEVVQAHRLQGVPGRTR